MGVAVCCWDASCLLPRPDTSRSWVMTGKGAAGAVGVLGVASAGTAGAAAGLAGAGAALGEEGEGEDEADGGSRTI